MEVTRRKMVLFAVNITAHPHETPEVYLEIFKTAANSIEGRISDTEYGRINGLFEANVEGANVPAVYGELIRYTEIEKNGRWFDTEKKTEADSYTVEKIAIPDHLRANLKSYQYMFFPHKHVLVFFSNQERKTLTVSMCVKLLRSIFESDEVVDKYGLVSVNPVTESIEIKKFIENYSMSWIRIVYDRPNPDHLHEVEMNMQSYMENANAKRIDKKLVAPQKQFLNLPEDVRDEAIVAGSRNGYVQAKAKAQDGTKVPFDSRKYPKKHDADIFPDEESKKQPLLSRFIAIASDFVFQKL